jgi:hypothetical protein
VDVVKGGRRTIKEIFFFHSVNYPDG